MLAFLVFLHLTRSHYLCPLHLFFSLKSQYIGRKLVLNLTKENIIIILLLLQLIWLRISLIGMGYGIWVEKYAKTDMSLVNCNNLDNTICIYTHTS
jgi:hypothetical protein